MTQLEIRMILECINHRLLELRRRRYRMERELERGYIPPDPAVRLLLRSKFDAVHEEIGAMSVARDKLIEKICP